jgi:hypothetical protein
MAAARLTAVLARQTRKPRAQLLALSLFLIADEPPRHRNELPPELEGAGRCQPPIGFSLLAPTDVRLPAIGWACHDFMQSRRSWPVELIGVRTTERIERSAPIQRLLLPCMKLVIATDRMQIPR